MSDGMMLLWLRLAAALLFVAIWQEHPSIAATCRSAIRDLDFR
jgi:hypothetical protein